MHIDLIPKFSRPQIERLKQSLLFFKLLYGGKMGKKVVKKSKDEFGFYDAKEDMFEKQFDDELEDYETDEDIGEEVKADENFDESYE